jgi:internalin A
MRPHRSIVVPLILIIALFRVPNALVIGQPAPAQPPGLSPEEVAEAFQAIQKFGCTHAGYGIETGRRMTLSAEDSKLPKDPSDYIGRFFFTTDRSWSSYALRFPDKTGDSDLARLAVSIRRLPSLASIDLGGTRIGDGALKPLAKLVGLQALFLDVTAISDASLRDLAGVENLRWLDLSRTRITDAGVGEAATHKTLRVVRLANNPQVTDKGLIELARLSELRTLNLSGTSVSLTDSVDLSGWKNLSRLDLSRCPIADDGIKFLAKLTALEELDLSGTSVTGTGLPALADLPKLRSLRLTDAPLTDEGAKGIAKLKQIRILYANNSPPLLPAPTEKSRRVPGAVRITDVGLAELGGCKSLRELNLARTAIKGEGFHGFAKHALLRDIDLEQSAITAACLLELREIPNIRSLNLARTAITGDGLQLLAQLPFLSRINLDESKANDDGMKLVARLKPLRDLSLQSTAVTSAGVNSLGENILVHLNLNKTKVDGLATKTLTGMKALRSLYLQGAAIPEGNLQQLKAALPDCALVIHAHNPPDKKAPPAPRLPLE